MKHERKLYLDNLRWSVVLLVVLYHVVYLYNGVQPFGVIGPFRDRQLQDALLYLLNPWFMLTLFVVSGASARYALEESGPREFLKKRTRRLLVPSTIGLFVFQWIQGILNMQVAALHTEGLEEGFRQAPGLVRYGILCISGTGVLWYLQVLWLLSLLLVPVRKLERGRLCDLGGRCTVPVLLALAVPLWGAAQVLNTPVVTVYRFGQYGLCFFLGYFVFAREQVVERLSRHWLPLTLLGTVLGLGSAWYYFGENYAVEPIVNSPLTVAYGWSGVLAAFALARRFGNRTSSGARWMQAHSFGLYVFHYLTLEAVGLLVVVPLELPALPAYVLTGLGAVLGGYSLYALISRIPFLRWAVLGMRKEKTHVSG